MARATHPFWLRRGRTETTWTTSAPPGPPIPDVLGKWLANARVDLGGRIRGDGSQPGRGVSQPSRMATRPSTSRTGGRSGLQRLHLPHQLGSLDKAEVISPVVLIKSFGLFWRAEEINWFPGKGNRQAFRLLGRHGKNRPGLRLADFRRQQGIYVFVRRIRPPTMWVSHGSRAWANG